MLLNLPVANSAYEALHVEVHVTAAGFRWRCRSEYSARTEGGAHDFEVRTPRHRGLVRRNRRTARRCRRLRCRSRSDGRRARGRAPAPGPGERGARSRSRRPRPSAPSRTRTRPSSRSRRGASRDRAGRVGTLGRSSGPRHDDGLHLPAFRSVQEARVASWSAVGPAPHCRRLRPAVRAARRGLRACSPFPCRT